MNWSSHGAKKISISPSKAAAATEDLPESLDALALEKTPASEDAPPYGRVQASGSLPANKESVSKMGGEISPTNTASEAKPPAPDASEQRLSMIEQLQLRSQKDRNEHNNREKEAKSSSRPVLAQKPSASPRPIPDAQTPRQPSPQTGNAPKLKNSAPSGRSGATASAGTLRYRPYFGNPIFDDEFFTNPSLGGSIFNELISNGFLRPSRSAPPQARPPQGRGSNGTTPSGGIPKAQHRICDICERCLPMEGSWRTCVTCTQGKQLACPTCGSMLKCLRMNHDVRELKL